MLCFVSMGWCLGQTEEDEGVKASAYLPIESYPTAGGVMDGREQRMPAKFEGDGDITGGYRCREKEDCAGATAQHSHVEHVSGKVDQIDVTLEEKMGHG